MSLFSELKQRNVFRAAAAYIALSWLVIQVAETIFPLFGLTEAAVRTVVIVLGVGFVPAVIAAWVFELTPEGLVRDSDVDRSSPTIKALGKRLDRLIILVLAVALGYFALDKFLFDPARDREREQEITEAAREEGRAEATQRSSDGPPMVAVLPFAAVGGGDESAFFATGVHDDLLTQLAQLQSVRVISRTSVMEYRDVERNIREIGEALGADAILEGGVQLAGDRIRINAQLIDAYDDAHLWAETFDRELTPSNIFEVQTEIARVIATEMHGTLSEELETSTAVLPTSNMAAYRTYHEALAFRDSVSGSLVMEEYREKLLEAADLDPSFTRPLAELVGSLTLEGFRGKNPVFVTRAEEALRRIETVSRGSADHLIAQAYYTYYVLNDHELAHEIVTRALEITPSDERLVELRSWIERRLGDFHAMIESIRVARRLNPRNLLYTGMLIRNLVLTHQYDAAAAEIESSNVIHHRLEATRAILEVRKHRDPSILEANLESLYAEFGDEAQPQFLWMAHLMNRNYAAAEKLLDNFPEPDTSRVHRRLGIPDKTTTEIMTYWLLGDGERLDALVEEAQAYLKAYEEKGGTQFHGRHLLGWALLAAVQGDAAETERFARRWDRTGGLDWAERVNQRDVVCEILAMAGAAESAVACIRTGLDEPSFVIPFLEPLWPFYDPIRTELAFVELIAELENSNKK